MSRETHKMATVSRPYRLCDVIIARCIRNVRYAVRETGSRLMVAGGSWFDRDDATGRRAGAEKFLLCPSASRDGFINIGRARRSGRGAQVARESAAAAAAPGRRGPGRPARNPEIRPRSFHLQLLSYARPDDSRLAAFSVSRQKATAKPRLKSWRGLQVGVDYRPSPFRPCKKRSNKN